jgi:ABC-type branched-subunit amino acid transport system substrate-binding protein
MHIAFAKYDKAVINSNKCEKIIKEEESNKMNKAKKIFACILMVSLIAVFFAGCGGSKSNNADSANEIKIGINYELSGRVASYGSSSVDGILLAFEKINEAGGVLGKKSACAHPFG